VLFRQDWGTDLRQRVPTATLQYRTKLINKRLNTFAAGCEPCEPAFIVISIVGTVIFVSELLHIASYEITV
jgi:hypothetical protein